MARTHVWADVRNRRRGDALVVLVALLIGGVIAWVVITVQGLAQDLHESNQRNDALAQQVKDLGGTPIVKPASPGIPGEQGPRGPRGTQGPRGASGKPAPTITPQPGKNGRDGANGAPGKPGSDSTVPGPSGAAGQNATGAPGPGGPAGPDGPQGEQGPAGKDGADGRDGTDGRDGQTCPTGYSLQPPPDDPDALVCRRDGAPDPTPEPSTAQPPAALLPDRRRS